MKKRIISLLLIMPFIVMMLVFGFSKTVSLLVVKGVEFIETEYSDSQDFEFDELGAAIELSAAAYPSTANNTELTWSVKGVECFSGEFDDAYNPIATVTRGGSLTAHKEGIVELTVATSDKSVSKSFEAVLVVSGGEAKYIVVNSVDTSESAIGTTRYFGLYNRSGETLTKLSETLTVKVIPSGAPQLFTAEAFGCVAAGECRYAAEGENSSEVSFSAVSAGGASIRFTCENGVSAEYSFIIPENSLNVRNYGDLMYATRESAPMAVVMRANLESSENVKLRANSSLFGKEENGSITHVIGHIDSTYDTRFYDLNGGVYEGRDKQLNVGVTFRRSVYGNGYTINAHELAFPSERQSGTGAAILGSGDLFRGPLYFVKAYECSCYGQDNIGFLALGDGLVIENIELKNCNNVDNLSDLDYTGTVLEIMGDDITVANCRIMNGRTAVRSFSNMNLTIDGCMISYAREFLLKVGSNKVVRAEPNMSLKGSISDYSVLSPELPDGDEYCDSTVTVRDTFFYTSGVFCVGLDTHFAGQYLYNFSSAINGLAGTSYRSNVVFDGDVRFYDWKQVDMLDSSTLISAGGDYSDIFDISDIIKNYYRNYKSQQIIYENGDELYVHGGIAFFGGGRNLSTIDMSLLKNEVAFLSPFSFSINDSNLGINGTYANILVRAAGYGKFSFYLYNPDYDEITIGSVPNLAELKSIVGSRT